MESGRMVKSRGAIDRISGLPDDVLIEILSFLDMKDIVKTGVLSRRWERIWTNIWFLDFCGPSSCEREAREKFVGFVNQTLSFHKGEIEYFRLRLCKVQSFGIGEEDAKRFKEFCLHVDRWIHQAVTRKVDTVILDLCKYKGVGLLKLYPYLPCGLYISSTITYLKVSHCRINPTSPLQWKSLMTLDLCNVTLNEESVENILKGSPLLKELYLRRCSGLRHLNITSPNLKYLFLCFYTRGVGLKIQAPHLRTLECNGELENYHLIDVSSLVSVIVLNPLIIFFRADSYQSTIGRFLKSVCHAEDFTVCTYCIQVLSIMEMNSHPIPSTKFTALELETNLTKWDLPGIHALLRSSPNLETIVIEKDYRHKLGVFTDEYLQEHDFNEANYWNLMLTSPCLMKALKCVHIYDFAGGSSETVLLEFLLRKAPVLHTMLIYSEKTKHSSQDSPQSASNDMSKLKEKVLSFQRASPGATISFL